MPSNTLPAYEVPRVITYTDEEILDALGPLQANVYDAIDDTGDIDFGGDS